MNKTNIILVGFMGTGKTTVGKILAEKLGLEFLDMDDIIVEREGKSIPRIFEEDGEPHFRMIEKKLVEELSGRSGLVVGAGGGIVLNPDNVANFDRTGLVVCLSATPEAIMERVRTDSNRPLLEGDDKMQKILSILESRKELYAGVPNQVDTTGLTAEQVADRIAALYNS